MNSKQELKKLVETLKTSFNMTQEELSSAAGYEPKSLTQAISKSTGHEAVIAKLKLVFSSTLENPTEGTSFARPKVLDEITKAMEVLKSAQETADVNRKYLALLEETLQEHKVSQYDLRNQATILAYNKIICQNQVRIRALLENREEKAVLIEMGEQLTEILQDEMRTDTRFLWESCHKQSLCMYHESMNRVRSSLRRIGN